MIPMSHEHMRCVDLLTLGIHVESMFSSHCVFNKIIMSLCRRETKLGVAFFVALVVQEPLDQRSGSEYEASVATL